MGTSANHDQVTLALVAGIPTHRRRAVLCKVYQRRRLAVTGRGIDDGQLTLEPALDGLAHPRPVQEAGRGGYQQFGADERKFGDRQV